MLLLTRANGQEIVIGSDTRLRVVSIFGNRVRLAVDAPSHIRVRRIESTGIESTGADAPQDDSPNRSAAAGKLV